MDSSNSNSEPKKLLEIIRTQVKQSEIRTNSGYRSLRFGHLILNNYGQANWTRQLSDDFKDNPIAYSDYSDYSDAIDNDKDFLTSNTAAIISQNHDGVRVRRFYQSTPQKEQVANDFLELSCSPKIETLSFSNFVRRYNTGFQIWDAWTQDKSTSLAQFKPDPHYVNGDGAGGDDLHFTDNVMRSYTEYAKQRRDTLHKSHFIKYFGLIPIEASDIPFCSDLYSKFKKDITEVEIELRGIQWRTENPGSQWTASFHPLPADLTKFYNGMYNGFTIGIPKDIHQTLWLIYRRGSNDLSSLPAGKPVARRAASNQASCVKRVRNSLHLRQEE